MDSDDRIVRRNDCRNDSEYYVKDDINDILHSIFDIPINHLSP